MQSISVNGNLSIIISVKFGSNFSYSLIEIFPEAIIL